MSATHDIVIARTERMKALTLADRVHAIAASDNVIGFTRFYELGRRRELETR